MDEHDEVTTADLARPQDRSDATTEENRSDPSKQGTTTESSDETNATLVADDTERTGDDQGIAAVTQAQEPAPALLPQDELDSFQSRWQPIQGMFVDEPSSAVGAADGLVAEVMQAVARSFADERARLEARWKQGEDVSTEDLRQTLQRYRSFFERLLSA